MSQLSKLRQKIRALVEDWNQTDTETFSYDANSVNPTIFQLEEKNTSAITKVLKNGEDITNSATIDLDTDSSPPQVTITLGSGDSWTDGDEINISYTFTDYSDTELTEYIRGALVYYSIYAHQDEDYELETNGIYPTPNNRTTDLIAMIAGVIIRPDWTQYDLPTIRVKFSDRMEKDEKIKHLCANFEFSWGRVGILEYN